MEKNKEKILTDKIIAAAENRAAALIKNAEETADKHLANVKASASADKETALNAAKAQARDLIDHRLSLSGLEINRDELKAKRGAVDKAFAEAALRMCERDPDEYVSVISRMIKKHGRDGDTVLLGRGDEKRITASTIAGISKALNIKLTLSKDAGDFTGGVMLLSKYSDKNLTFESIFRMIREEIEPEVAKTLFK